MIPRRRHQLDELLQELDDRQSQKAGGQSPRPRHSTWVRDRLLRVLSVVLPWRVLRAAVLTLARVADLRSTASAWR
jgi:hypothetical protein